MQLEGRRWAAFGWQPRIRETRVLWTFVGTYISKLITMMAAQNEVKLVERYTSWALTKALQAATVVLVGAEGEVSERSKKETTENQNTIFIIPKCFKGKEDWKKHSSAPFRVHCKRSVRIHLVQLLLLFCNGIWLHLVHKGNKFKIPIIDLGGG